MQKEKKMKTVAFSAIKGGVGKSSICILTANYLASTGARVLLIDLDIQNSLTFYYDLDSDEIENKNIAKALMSRNLLNNIIQVKKTMAIVPSKLELVNLRAIADKTLSRMMVQADESFDYCLIDTPPTYDNIVLNGVNASDLVISPARFSVFDLKSAAFYKNQLEADTEKANNWRVLFNFYKEPRTNNPDAEINQYSNLFCEIFGESILKTKIPETGYLKKAIDSKSVISRAKAKEKLFESIKSLCNEITDGDLVEPEGF
jgi:chromosome partitioning protein